MHLVHEYSNYCAELIPVSMSKLVQSAGVLWWRRRWCQAAWQMVADYSPAPASRHRPRSDHNITVLGATEGHSLTPTKPRKYRDRGETLFILARVGLCGGAGTTAVRVPMVKSPHITSQVTCCRCGVGWLWRTFVKISQSNAPTRDFSWLKVPTSAFLYKTQWRHAHAHALC